MDEGYRARSFEDSFISRNIEIIKKNLDNITGLKCLNEFDDYKSYYSLTEKVIDKKSDFAASLLYLAHTKDIEWVTPIYIEEGLKWIQL